jgi:hypothetical protein
MSWRASMRTECAMTGLIVLAVLRTGSWSGHITPGRVLQGNPWSPSGNPCPVNGLRAASFPGAHKDSLRQRVCSLRVTAVAVSALVGVNATSSVACAGSPSSRQHAQRVAVADHSRRPRLKLDERLACETLHRQLVPAVARPRTIRPSSRLPAASAPRPGRLIWVADPCRWSNRQKGPGVMFAPLILEIDHREPSTPRPQQPR